MIRVFVPPSTRSRICAWLLSVGLFSFAVERTLAASPSKGTIDPVYVEAAQALGRRLVREGGATMEERIRFGLKLVLARPPENSEVIELKKLYEFELANYASNEPEALKIATNPLASLPDGWSAAEAAAWTMIANVLLNLDGVLTKG